MYRNNNNLCFECTSEDTHATIFEIIVQCIMKQILFEKNENNFISVTSSKKI